MAEPISSLTLCDKLSNTTYKLSLDELDLQYIPVNYCNTDSGTLKPLWSNRHHKEYKEFELFVTQRDYKQEERTDFSNAASDDNNKSLLEQCMCHICNISVPKLFIRSHYNSTKHIDNCKIASHALDRVKKQINYTINLSEGFNITATDLYFCETCVCVVPKDDKSSHERTQNHNKCMEQDNVLANFVKAYVEEDGLEENCTNNVEVMEEYDGKNDSCPQYQKETDWRFKDEIFNNNKNKIHIVTQCNSSVTNSDEINSNDLGENEANVQVTGETSVEQTCTAKTKISAKSRKLEACAIRKARKEKSKECLIRLNSYLEYITSHYPYSHSLSAITDELIKIKAMNGDTICVYVDNFHSYSLSSKAETVRCMLCMTHLKVHEREAHKYTEGHVRRLMAPIEDKHGFRKIETFDDWNNCLVCNTFVISVELDNHKTNFIHQNNLKKACENCVFTIKVQTRREKNLPYLISYIEYISSLHTSSHKLKVLDDEWIEVSATNGDRLKMHIDTFHSYTIVSECGSTYCRICNIKLPSKFKESHKFDDVHIRRIMMPIIDRHCIRKNDICIDTQYCLLCQEFYKNVLCDHHKKLNTTHINNVKAILLSSEPIVCNRNINDTNNMPNTSRMSSGVLFCDTSEVSGIHSGIHTNNVINKYEKEPITTSSAHNNRQNKANIIKTEVDCHGIATKSTQVSQSNNVNINEREIRAVSTKSMQVDQVDNVTENNKIAFPANATNSAQGNHVLAKNEIKVQATTSTHYNQRNNVINKNEVPPASCSTDIYCVPCKINIQTHNMPSHLSGNKHKTSLKQHINSINVYIKTCTNNSNQVICRVCNVFICNNTNNITEHINGSKHGMEYQKTLQTNKINSANNTHMCESCNVTLKSPVDILNHIDSANHKSQLKQKTQKKKERCNICQIEMSANSMASHIAGKQHKEKVSTLKEGNYHICDICKVQVPNNPNNIDIHNKGGPHKNAMQKTADKHNFLITSDCTFFCRVCNKFLNVSQVLEHVNDQKHSLGVLTMNIKGMIQQ